jgi:hypothetical protein
MNAKDNVRKSTQVDNRIRYTHTYVHTYLYYPHVRFSNVSWMHGQFSTITIYPSKFQEEHINRALLISILVGSTIKVGVLSVSTPHYPIHMPHNPHALGLQSCPTLPLDVL